MQNFAGANTLTFDRCCRIIKNAVIMKNNVGRTEHAVATLLINTGMFMLFKISELNCHNH